MEGEKKQYVFEDWSVWILRFLVACGVKFGRKRKWERKESEGVNKLMFYQINNFMLNLYMFNASIFFPDLICQVDIIFLVWCRTYRNDPINTM